MEEDIKIKRNEAHKAILLRICELIKDKPLDERELISKLQNERLLKSKIYGFKKTYLKPLINSKRIIYLKKDKNNKYFFRIAYEKEWNSTTKMYYLETPRAGLIYDRLASVLNRFKDIQETEKLHEVLNEALNYYTSLEIMVHFQEKEFFDDKLIKRNLKKKGKDLTDDEIKKLKDNAITDIMNFAGRNINIKLTGIEGFKEEIVNGESCFEFFGSLIKISDISTFLSSIKLSNTMHWLAYKSEENLINIATPMNAKFIEFYLLLHQYFNLNKLVGGASPYPNQTQATHYI